jgi:hypothetical protein
VVNLISYGDSDESYQEVQNGDVIDIDFQNPDFIDKYYELMSLYISDVAIVQQTSSELREGSFVFGCSFRTIDETATWQWQYSEDGENWIDVVEDPPRIEISDVVTLPVLQSKLVASELIIATEAATEGLVFRLAVSGVFQTASLPVSFASAGSSSSAAGSSSSAAGSSSSAAGSSSSAAGSSSSTGGCDSSSSSSDELGACCHPGILENDIWTPPYCEDLILSSECQHDFYLNTLCANVNCSGGCDRGSSSSTQNQYQESSSSAENSSSSGFSFQYGTVLTPGYDPESNKNYAETFDLNIASEEELMFSFDPIENASGLPVMMELVVSGSSSSSVLAATVAVASEYVGNPFQIAFRNELYDGEFASGQVNL